MSVMQVERSWIVMNEMVPHRVDATLSMLTGRTRVKIDDQIAVDASGWRMGPGGKHIEFPVKSRQCTLVVRPKPADPSGPELDLHVDGWSLDHGTRLEERLAREASSPSALMRMALIFLPLIGVPSILRNASQGGGLSPMLGWTFAGAGLLLGLIGFFTASRWYAARRPSRARSTVGWLIVLGCYALLFGVYAVLLGAQG